MSEKSDGVKGGVDMSAFEVQFEGDGDLSSLAEEGKQASFTAEQAHRDAIDASRIRHSYDRALAEKDLPHKSLRDKLRHLNEAYSAALDLEPLGMLPSPGILGELQIQIIAVKALIHQEETRDRP